MDYKLHSSALSCEKPILLDIDNEHKVKLQCNVKEVCWGNNEKSNGTLGVVHPFLPALLSMHLTKKIENYVFYLC